MKSFEEDFTKGFVYIHAYFKLRKAPRSFRHDRMSNIIDLKTGEVFESCEDYLKSLEGDNR